MQLHLGHKFLEASASLALAFFISPVSASANEIAAALTNRTAFEAGKAYWPWRQYFAADGTTIYFGDGPSSLGKWEVRGDQYCSLWPPVKDWVCYGVKLTPPPYFRIVWIGPDGQPTEGELFDGDLTGLRAAPKR